MIFRLPNRRDAPTISFALFDGYSSQRYEAQYAHFLDGSLAEVFLRPIESAAAKPGLPLDNIAKDLSVLFSIARRYGAPVAVIKAALSQQEDGKMLGPLGEFLRLHDENDDGGEAIAVPVPVQPGDGGAVTETVAS